MRFCSRAKSSGAGATIATRIGAVARLSKGSDSLTTFRAVQAGRQLSKEAQYTPY
jgi:hypothetical protein